MDEQDRADATGYGTGDPYRYPEVPSERVDPFGDAAAGGAADGSSTAGPDPFGSGAPDWRTSSSAYGPAPSPAVGPAPTLPGSPYAPYAAGADQRAWAPAQPYVSPARPTSGMAVASLVLGILSITMCGGLTALPGLICGIIGMRETGPTGPNSGRGLAIAGVVTSIIGCLILLGSVLYVLLVIGALALSAPTST